jgi:signal transduction histidine kinase
LDPEFRHSIFLAFMEALNNVVRHSGATEAALKIEADHEALLFAVTDNGLGLGSDPQPSEKTA